MQPLFSAGDLHQALESKLSEAGAVIDSIPTEQFLNSTDDVMVEHAVSKLRVNPLELALDLKTMEVEEALVAPNAFYTEPRRRGQAGVPGTRVTVTVPFSGDGMLLALRPSSVTNQTVRARVVGSGDPGALQLVFEHATGVPPEQVNQEVDRKVATLASQVRNQRGQVDNFNTALTGKVLMAIAARRARLAEQNRLVEVLKIPLKTKMGAPLLLAMKRKLVRPLPAAPRGHATSEPAISDETYEHILRVLRHVGRTFEAVPRTFYKLDEEELRDILLAHLNGHYEGDAVGEAFRRAGKTDLRVEDTNRCAFVAECKIWDGESRLQAAVDQLLGYLTWRDCKAALIIFNKSVGGFSQLLEKVPHALETHPLSRGAVPLVEAGEWQGRFASRDDASREVLVHVFLFNIYQREEAA